MKRLFGFCLFLCLPLLAMQPPPSVVLGVSELAFSGSGCLSGAKVRLIDASSMTYEIEFDGFILSTGENRSTYESRACNVAVPVIASPDKSVSVSRISYSGVNDLSGAILRILLEAFFDGTRSALLQNTVVDGGPLHSEIDLTEAEKSWSPCNLNSTLHINLFSDIRGDLNLPKSTSVMDGKLIFKLEVKPC